MSDHSTDSFDTLMEGILIERHSILDGIGITISIAGLPSYPLKEYLSGQLFGRGRLSRFWCLWIRPWLMHRRQVEIQGAFEIAVGHVQQELLNATLEKGQEAIGQ